MIRPTTPADTETLIAIASGTNVFKALELVALREVLDDYHAVNRADGHRAITSEQDGRILGFAYYAPTPMTDHTWHLYWIAVLKSEHAKGIGTELLKQAEADVISERGRLFLIETSGLPHYEPTRNFYLKHGYEPAAHIRDFYAEGDDQIVFWKKLNPSSSQTR